MAQKRDDSVSRMARVRRDALVRAKEAGRHVVRTGNDEFVGSGSIAEPDPSKDYKKAAKAAGGAAASFLATELLTEGLGGASAAGNLLRAARAARGARTAAVGAEAAQAVRTGSRAAEEAKQVKGIIARTREVAREKGAIPADRRNMERIAEAARKRPLDSLERADAWDEAGEKELSGRQLRGKRLKERQ